MKKLLIIIFLFITSSFLNGFLGQNSEVKYVDKSYYLVYSLDLSELGEVDLNLLDNYLKNKSSFAKERLGLHFKRKNFNEISLEKTQYIQ